MKIQIISGYKFDLEDKNEYKFTHSTLDNPKAFDAFDLNFINLQSENIWVNEANNTTNIIAINDFLTLKKLICDAKKAKIIICLPQNYQYSYCFLSNRFFNRIKLKDMIQDMLQIIQNLEPYTASFKLMFENSTTLCDGNEINADFCFTEVSASCKILTKNIGGEHPTTITVKSNLLLTTLELFKNNKIEFFLSEIGIGNQEVSAPEWIKEVQFYNDEEQNKIIEVAKQQIKKAEADIHKATTVLLENMFYKRVLFESGTPLVESVFKMLEKMLNCDLSDFVDNKREDFKIVLPEVTFIGEIKGINTNVKAENISQLEVHCSEYSDQLDDQGKTENIKGILIINPQRSKPLNERDSVNQKQINIAIRNESLIITSDVFLLLFERFMLGHITTEQIKQIFIEKKGLLTHQSFISE